MNRQTDPPDPGGALLRDVFEKDPSGILLVRSDGAIVDANPAACQALGCERDDLVGAPMMSRVHSLDGGGGGRSFRLGDFQGEVRFARADGSRFPADARVFEVQEAGGSADFLVFFRDASERLARDRRYSDYLRLEQKARLVAQDAEQRSGYLAEVTSRLASSLDAEDTLRTIVQLSVEGFATFCIVYLRAPDESIVRHAYAHANPEMRAVLDQVAEHPIPVATGGVLESTILAGKPLLLSGPELRIERLISVGEAHRALLETLSTTSAMLVPLRARDRVLGTIGFFRGPDTDDFIEEDLRVAESLAQTTAFAIDNARLYEEARAADRARREMLSVIAHDLRSPLGAVSVSTEMLLEFEMEEEARRYHLDVIQRAAGRMSRLIQDLVDAARIESGRLTLEPYPQPAGSIVEEACSLFLARSAAIDVELSWSFAPDLPDVLVDRARILQVMTNLLENAFKYVRRGGRIGVEVDGSGEGVRVSVSDDGKGIPEADLPSLFDPFWQARMGGEEKGGAGLGLAIARGIVLGHGGRIWVESQEGEGTTFHFTLPPASGESLPGGTAPTVRLGPAGPVGSFRTR